MDTNAPLAGLSGTKGLAHAKPAPPSTLVIFGAAGDLTRRLLMPSLYNLHLGASARRRVQGHRRRPQ